MTVTFSPWLTWEWLSSVTHAMKGPSVTQVTRWLPTDSTNNASLHKSLIALSCFLMEASIEFSRTVSERRCKCRACALRITRA
eukprot:10867406-Heterocapsa_arctica.AAC.1